MNHPGPPARERALNNWLSVRISTLRRRGLSADAAVHRACDEAIDAVNRIYGSIRLRPTTTTPPDTDTDTEWRSGWTALDRP